MKEAALKDKPERRSWEEAASFFKWTCGNYAHVERARQLAAFEDKLEAAEAFRQQGNSDFVEHKLDEALLKLVSHFQCNDCLLYMTSIELLITLERALVADDAAHFVQHSCGHTCLYSSTSPGWLFQ
jgi:hypothetical protein